MKLSSLLKQCAIAAVITVTASAAAEAAPQILGETARSECRQAFQIANAKFRSPDNSMDAPIVLPKNAPVHFALQVVESDISGGDGLVSDKATFNDVAPKQKDSELRRIYWQIKPQDGKRIVVVDKVFNWRGDWYSMYALDENVAPEALIADLATEDRFKRHFKPVIDENWTPPQVLVDSGSGNAWVLQQDSGSYQALGSWTVYAGGADGFASRCTVGFMPDVRDAVTLLPQPVQRFAALLTEVLGPGTDEGTLHPTGRIQGAADLDWANIALRPWALNNSTYNSRATVDAGLKQWATVNRRRRVVYGALMRQYPNAESALAAHYVSRFHVTRAQADAMAHYATDLVFREYFVFSSDVPAVGSFDTGKPASNPWHDR